MENLGRVAWKVINLSKGVHNWIFKSSAHIKKRAPFLLQVEERWFLLKIVSFPVPKNYHWIPIKMDVWKESSICFLYEFFLISRKVLSGIMEILSSHS